MSQNIARRTRTRARIITIVTSIAVVLVLAGGGIAIAMVGEPRNGILAAYVFAAATTLVMAAVFGAITMRLTRALRALEQWHPDGVVFLARRLPPIVSDLPAYLRSKGLDVRIGDGWFPALADHRGIAVFTPGSAPRELLVMEWGEIGDVEMVRTATVGGDYRWSVTVDVKPYPVPLTADVGAAWGFVTMAVDAADTAAIVEAVTAQRPMR